MVATQPVSSNLTAIPKAPEQACLDAWHFAGEIEIHTKALPPMAQAVFLAWLKSQSGGVLKGITPQEIFLWLFRLSPGLAEAEYRLALLEISWLVSLMNDFFNFLEKGAL